MVGFSHFQFGVWIRTIDELRLNHIRASFGAQGVGHLVCHFHISHFTRVSCAFQTIGDARLAFAIVGLVRLLRGI